MSFLQSGYQQRHGSLCE